MEAADQPVRENLVVTRKLWNELRRELRKMAAVSVRNTVTAS
jgi:hypothetical protein